MFCPQCGAEFLEGIVLCSDCKVSLVEDPPVSPKAEWVELVTVLSSSNPAVIAVGKSLLEAAGIDCVAKGEELQDLFAIGRVGGFNPVTGPVEIQVLPSMEREARRLLADLEGENPGEGDVGR